MKQTQEMTQKEKFLTFLSSNLHKYGKYLLYFVIAVLIILIIMAIVSEVNNNKIDKSTLLVEQVQNDYKNWISETDDKKKKEIEKIIVTNSNEIIENYPKLYAAQRSLFILGDIAFRNNQWTEAISLYTKLADSFPESYLAPVGIFIAAVAQEETGNIPEAIDLYKILTSKYTKTSTDIPRAFFSMGRLYESMNMKTEAADSYNQLIDNFSSSNWTKLARSRIIILNIE